MTLAPGARLGAYEIVSFIAAGGMGEVYKAVDTRLDRLVALKIARTEFDDRFNREARAIATLNHPHICTLHDVGANYLVMEYVDGSALHGPLPIAQALKYAAEIADALDAAHKQHIIHRDLKPANILITKAGVKLLDFGLAKNVTSAPSMLATTAATAEAPLTRQGTILGTVSYMSPEQLQGRDADARSDIFAFGLVLYEMLTGRRAFDGASPASVIAAILERSAPTVEPELQHRAVNRIIATCLAKDPDDRFQTARDLKRSLDWSLSGSGTANSTQRASKTWIVWTVALALCSVVAAAGWLRPRPVDQDVDFALTIAPPDATGIAPIGSSLARPQISPDGAFVTYHDRTNALQLRRLNSIAPEPLLRAAGVLTTEVWASDSKSLVFADATNLKRVRVPDGAPEIIAKLPGPFLTGTLSDSGTLLFVTILGGTSSSLYMIPAGGSEPRQVDLPGVKEAGTGYSSPWFLPGGEEFLIGFRPRGSAETEFYLATLRDGSVVDPVLLMKNANDVRYTAAGGGRIVFARDSNLYARRLNRTTRRLEGDEELIVENVATSAVSLNGIVAWRPGRPQPAQVTIFDRRGTPIGTAGPATGFLSLKLSPDERHLLISAPAQSWLLEPNSPGRVNVSQGNITMLWSPDPRRVLVPQGSRIVERPLSGAGDGRELADAPGLARLEDLSADGKTVLFTKGAFASAVYAVRLDGSAEERRPTPVLETGEWVWNTRFSPDGRWIVFQVAGQDSGIYVQEFPGPSLRKQIATAGEYPVWRKDGKEILYLESNRIWSVPVDVSGPQLRAGTPVALFSVRPVSRVLDVSPLAVSRDGSRIYFPQAVEQPDSDVIHIRMGWDRGK
jgi:eukaryotic-like serine/threonine-protein kinase